MQLLETWQHSLGLLGFTGVTLVVGFVSGLVVGRFPRRQRVAVPIQESETAAGEQVEVKLSTATPDGLKSPREQRRNPRRAGRSVEVFVSIPGSSADPCKAVVLDRSVGGLKLLVGDEYKPGSHMKLLPTGASQMTPWVDVGVKTCRKTGDDWEVGVQFQSVPPYATMVLFG